MREAMDQNLPCSPAHPPLPRILRPPRAISADFAQVIIQTPIRKMEQPLPAPARRRAKLNFFVDLFVLIAATLASEQPQHLVTAPGSMADFLPPKIIAPPDPVTVIARVFK